jgi:hypothetical protein
MIGGRDRRRVEHADTENEEESGQPRNTDGEALAHVLLLQQSAGNAAVSRLVAGRSLQRQQPDGGAPAAPAAPSPGAQAPAGGGAQDPTLSMARIAWDTGVTQRERDAAKKLAKPGVSKGEMEDANHQLSEAEHAIESIGGQLAVRDPGRKVRADVHSNAVIGANNLITTIVKHKTPHDISKFIEDSTVPSSQHAIDDLTAPFPAAPSGSSPAPSTNGSSSAPPAATTPTP